MRQSILLFSMICAFSGVCKAQNGPPPERVVFTSGGSNDSNVPVSLGEPFGGNNGQVTIGAIQNGSLSSVGVPTRDITNTGNRIILFPNPVGDVLNIQVLGENQDNYTVVIRDILGREVLRKKNIHDAIELSLSSFGSGALYITIESKDSKELFSQTIIKK
jgi:hypothetical protein